VRAEGLFMALSALNPKSNTNLPRTDNPQPPHSSVVTVNPDHQGPIWQSKLRECYNRLPPIFFSK